MDVVILCGGMGTRLSEETITKPKPMVEIGGKPILWHIMKYYSSFGFNRFVLALGYKSNYIKEYFYNYKISNSDFTIDLNPENKPKFHNVGNESNWEITFIDTGLHTLKGARIKKVEKYIRKIIDEIFPTKIFRRNNYDEKFRRKMSDGNISTKYF